MITAGMPFPRTGSLIVSDHATAPAFARTLFLAAAGAFVMPPTATSTAPWELSFSSQRRFPRGIRGTSRNQLKNPLEIGTQDTLLEELNTR